MGRDGRSFTCDGCAAAPRLQKLNGCWEELPRPVAEYAGHAFVRCPVLSMHPRASGIADMVRDRVWPTMTGLERRRLSPKLAAALLHCTDYVLKFAEAPGE